MIVGATVPLPHATTDWNPIQQSVFVMLQEVVAPTVFPVFSSAKTTCGGLSYVIPNDSCQFAYPFDVTDFCGAVMNNRAGTHAFPDRT